VAPESRYHVCESSDWSLIATINHCIRSFFVEFLGGFSLKVRFASLDNGLYISFDLSCASFLQLGLICHGLS
jgi:hypothetical protein